MPTRQAEIKTDPKNARKHSPRNLGQIERSIQHNGFGRSILLANDGTIIAGNATFDAASSIGLADVQIVESDGTKVIAIQRTDVEPGSPQFRELALADNRAAELADWDTDVLRELADDGVDLGQFWFEDELAEILAKLDEPVQEDGKYSVKVETPIYEPTGEKPYVSELVNRTRFDSLDRGIRSSNAPEEVKEFLLVAASRHIVFDYRKIAEFYAHADPETQRLMEDSALVIVDVNRAIELGYAKFRAEILSAVDGARNG